jgi:Patatin phospholipase
MSRQAAAAGIDLSAITNTLARFLEQVPEEFKRSDDAKFLMSVAKQQVHHLVNLVYRPTSPEDASKENEFSTLNVICCETAIRLESGAKHKWLALSQNVADDPKAKSLEATSFDLDQGIGGHA